MLLLANGFEIYEASVFIDVFGWNRTEGDGSTVLYTCGLNKELHAAFGLSINTDFMIQDICVNEYEALAIPG